MPFIECTSCAAKEIAVEDFEIHQCSDGATFKCLACDGEPLGRKAMKEHLCTTHGYAPMPEIDPERVRATMARFEAAVQARMAAQDLARAAHDSDVEMSDNNTYNEDAYSTSSRDFTADNDEQLNTEQMGGWTSLSIPIEADTIIKFNGSAMYTGKIQKLMDRQEAGVIITIPTAYTHSEDDEKYEIRRVSFVVSYQGNNSETLYFPARLLPYFPSIPTTVYAERYSAAQMDPPNRHAAFTSAMNAARAFSICVGAHIPQINVTGTRMQVSLSSLEIQQSKECIDISRIVTSKRLATRRSTLLNLECYLERQPLPIAPTADDAVLHGFWSRIASDNTILIRAKIDATPEIVHSIPCKTVLRNSVQYHAAHIGCVLNYTSNTTGVVRRLPVQFRPCSVSREYRTKIDPDHSSYNTSSVGTAQSLNSKLRTLKLASGIDNVNIQVRNGTQLVLSHLAVKVTESSNALSVSCPVAYCLRNTASEFRLVSAEYYLFYTATELITAATGPELVTALSLQQQITGTVYESHARSISTSALPTIRAARSFGFKDIPSKFDNDYTCGSELWLAFTVPVHCLSKLTIGIEPYRSMFYEGDFNLDAIDFGGSVTLLPPSKLTTSRGHTYEAEIMGAAIVYEDDLSLPIIVHEETQLNQTLRRSVMPSSTRLAAMQDSVRHVIPIHAHKVTRLRVFGARSQYSTGRIDVLTVERPTALDYIVPMLIDMTGNDYKAAEQVIVSICYKLRSYDMPDLNFLPKKSYPVLTDFNVHLHALVATSKDVYRVSGHCDATIFAHKGDAFRVFRIPVMNDPTSIAMNPVKIGPMDYVIPNNIDGCKAKDWVILLQYSSMTTRTDSLWAVVCAPKPTCMVETIAFACRDNEAVDFERAASFAARCASPVGPNWSVDLCGPQALDATQTIVSAARTSEDGVCSISMPSTLNMPHHPFAVTRIMSAHVMVRYGPLEAVAITKYSTDNDGWHCAHKKLAIFPESIDLLNNCVDEVCKASSDPRIKNVGVCITYGADTFVFNGNSLELCDNDDAAASYCKTKTYSVPAEVKAINLVVKDCIQPEYCESGMTNRRALVFSFASSNSAGNYATSASIWFKY